MQLINLLGMALMATMVVARPSHLRHRKSHGQHAAIEKRSVVLMTELVVVTECVSTTVTSLIGPGETPTTILPPSIDTRPQTKTIGPSPSAGGSTPGAFHEVPASTQSQPIVQATQPAAPSYSAPSTHSQPASTTNAQPSIQQASAQAAQPSTTAASSSAAASSASSAAQSQSAPVSGGGSNLYNLALPPTKLDYATQCMDSTCSGKATYYNGITDEMCCGYNGMTGQDGSKRIAALPVALMGSSSNSNGPGLPNQPTNGNCARVISVSCPSTGKSTTVQVVDKCMGCPSTYSLDMSEAAFEALGIELGTGVADITWKFLS